MILPYISHFSVSHHFSLLKILSRHIIILLPMTFHLYISLHTHIFPSQFIFNLSAHLYTNISFPSSIFSPNTVHSSIQNNLTFPYPNKTLLNLHNSQHFHNLLTYISHHTNK